MVRAGLEERVREIFALLDCVVPAAPQLVLDVGAGHCEIAKFLATKGHKVRGVGVAISSYGMDFAALEREYGVTVQEADAEALPFPDATFDVVLLSHVLEHVKNVGLVLAECRRVLRKGGMIIVMVPPHDIGIGAGHINMGWNLGQLMYLLAAHGLDVRTGHFIEYGSSVCAVAYANPVSLPQLIGDHGDIRLLNRANLFPLSIPGDPDGFVGLIWSVNWPGAEKLLKRQPNGRKRFLYYLSRSFGIFPARLRLSVAKIFFTLSKYLVAQANPKHLSPP